MSTTKKTHSLKNPFSKNTNDKANLKNFFRPKEQSIFRYLQNHSSTTSMVSKASGIPQKNITCFKRDLEKHGLLYEVEKKLSELIGFKACYLATNLDLFPKSNAKKLRNV